MSYLKVTNRRITPSESNPHLVYKEYFPRPELRYSDDQPRDDHGRFTSGGSLSVAAINDTGLTSGSENDTIDSASNSHPRDYELEQTIQRCISQEKAVFADDLAAYFEKIPAESGKSFYAMHGTDDSVEIFGHKIDERTLANIIRSRNDYNPDNEIVLISCNTGSTERTENCFAQRLANELGQTVRAPQKLGIISISGDYYSGDKSFRKDGDFIPFTPKKGDE